MWERRNSRLRRDDPHRLQGVYSWFLTNLKMVLAYQLPCVRTIVLADPEEPVDFCHARNLRCGAIECL